MGKPAVSTKRRMAFALVGMVMIFLLLITRLFWLQVIQGKELSEKALSQQTQDTSLSATRGSILDCTGTVLAQSGTAYKVLINPNVITQSERNRIASELSEILNMDYNNVLTKVSDVTKQEIVLKRQVERGVVDEILSRKLGGGVYTAIDSKRYYPSGSLFSQLLGFTTIDGIGQAGLEQKYEKYLAGEDGRMITEVDRKGNAIAYGAQEIIEPENGCDVVLTADSVVESFLEKALKEALEVNGAETAQGIVMNCKTGEILAMSTQPDYDPNEPPRSDIKILNSLSRNRIVADTYEPGSTFKIVTLSSSLDSGAVDLNTSYYCNGGIVVNGERIKCWKSGGHGSQTLIEAVQNSCNPAFVSMALSMGTETFYDYIYAYGMGSSTGSGIPGETGGIVTHQKYMTQNTLARIGFGQSIAVTPIQLCTAVCAAVNGGELMQPYMLERIISPSGEVLVQNSPTVVRRVISAETSRTVREILESVVTNGSGRNAQIPGYRVGGKTGTAQKYDETGAVDSGKLIASFVGFAPADDPEFVCLILVDEPKVGVIFGSTVAAPFVKQVMEETLRHYGFLPTQNAETVSVPDVSGMTVEEAKAALKEVNLDVVYQDQLTDVVVAQVPAANESVNSNTEVLLYTENTSAEDTAEDPEMVKVPNVVGMSRLAASDALDSKGLQIKIDPEDQTGTAIRQVPEKDTLVQEGTQVLVEFSNVNLE